MMFVYFVRARAKSPEAVAEICRVFHHNLQLVQEPGWQGGACLADVNDPRGMLIYENWGTLAALKAWESSEARAFAYQQLLEQVEGQPQTMIFQDVA
jgi:heme-degrading monooxygenase HmoA